jgi:hypothetical protein
MVDQAHKTTPWTRFGLLQAEGQLLCLMPGSLPNIGVALQEARFMATKRGWNDAKNAVRDAWYRVERNQLNSFGGEGVNMVDRAWNYRGSPICTSPWNSSIAPK